MIDISKFIDLFIMVGVVALGEIIKLTPLYKIGWVKEKFPIVVIFLGLSSTILVSAFSANVNWARAVLQGAINGVASAGFYDTIKALFKPEGNIAEALKGLFKTKG